MKKDIVDMHAHPSLKLYYMPYLLKNFKIKTFSGPIFNPLGMRTRYSNIKKSSVKVIVNAHYVIERDFIKIGFKKVTRGLLWGIAPTLLYKIITKDPYQSLIEQFDILENSVKKSNKSLVEFNKKRLKMIYSASEIDNLKDNEVAIIHAIEGVHSLGYKPKDNETLEQFFIKIKERLLYLKSRGLAMVGISHFWDNMYLPQTDGTEIISKKVNGKITSVRDDKLFQMKKAKWRWGDSKKLSKEFIELLLENNILIDVVHTQIEAREEIYKLCARYNKPVVVSHVGLKHFFNHEYNLSDKEILTIHKLGGVIGLILSKRWLVAPKNRKRYKGGLDDLVENIKYIKKLTGDVSTITIGTDFDGFTTPFTDCYTYADMDKLVDKLLEEFSQDEVEKILHKNAIRVLKAGWR